MTSASSSLTTSPKINASAFYFNYYGHSVEDLGRFREIATQKRPEKPIIFLAGDSSLDNKFWIPSTGPGGEPLPVQVPAIYEYTLDHPRPKPDVAFWLNHVMGDNATCINAAIEESKMSSRTDKLLPQDEFIRDNIRSNDILIVSVGANDIVLKPALSTIWHMLILARFTRRSSIVNGTASSLAHFHTIFHDDMKSYIERLTSITKPRAVIINMIYFPLEKQFDKSGKAGWADKPLKWLGYESDPEQLREAIRKMFETSTCKVKVQGTEVVTCALFEVMDGTRGEEYVERVEPSVIGGRKMAERYRELLQGLLAP
jgi:hypothetical protein